MKSDKRKLVHFGSWDPRFCGTREQCHQFTVDDNEVTCPACQDRDRFVLSPQGQALVDELAAKKSVVT